MKVRETGEKGKVVFRKVEKDGNAIIVKYQVRIGDWNGRREWYQRKDLEHVRSGFINDVEKNVYVYPKEYFTTRDLGDGRHVVVLGIVDTYYDDFISEQGTRLDVYTRKSQKVSDALLFFKHHIKKKRLRIAWAISHPEDEFNLDTGIDIARKRCRRRPMSVLESEFVGEFREDLVTAVLDVKANFIANNIEKFTDKK